jgi:hypothetical protein
MEVEVCKVHETITNGKKQSREFIVATNGRQ